MIKEYTFHYKLFGPELVLRVDESKFTEELATEINNFFSGGSSRLDRCGCVKLAALKLYVQEMFQIVAFNPLACETTVTNAFDWDIKGVEGFPNLEDAGISISYIDNWEVDFEDIILK